MDSQELDALAEKAADLIRESRRLVVFTGAGISTESGIPDFRSPGGIWDRFDPDDFTIERFLNNPDSRRKQWYILKEGLMTDKAVPNAAHDAIAELYRMDMLDCVITQNIDNLHEKAGVPAGKVFELHGNMQWAVCLQCGRRFPLDKIKARLDSGEDIPDCEACGGMLKPDIVMFGEQLPVKVLEEASARAMAADLCIVVGSTLIVYPAALMPVYAVESGARLIIVNLSATPMDDRADVLINNKAGEAMSGIVAKVKEKLGR
ncbi:MAG: Sir2 family NAD-dependent protein deacetylase [Dehalococcoidales bacterium]|nr:Sir2 family NAD-dependent protein deacetylase [Dehalococcoidales bacterium]